MNIDWKYKSQKYAHKTNNFLISNTNNSYVEQYYAFKNSYLKKSMAGGSLLLSEEDFSRSKTIHIAYHGKLNPNNTFTIPPHMTVIMPFCCGFSNIFTTHYDNNNRVKEWETVKTLKTIANTQNDTIVDINDKKYVILQEKEKYCEIDVSVSFDPTFEEGVIEESLSIPYIPILNEIDFNRYTSKFFEKIISILKNKGSLYGYYDDNLSKFEEIVHLEVFVKMFEYKYIDKLKEFVENLVVLNFEQKSKLMKFLNDTNIFSSYVSYYNQILLIRNLIESFDQTIKNEFKKFTYTPQQYYIEFSKFVIADTIEILKIFYKIKTTLFGSSSIDNITFDSQLFCQAIATLNSEDQSLCKEILQFYSTVYYYQELPEEPDQSRISFVNYLVDLHVDGDTYETEKEKLSVIAKAKVVGKYFCKIIKIFNNIDDLSQSNLNIINDLFGGTRHNSSIGKILNYIHLNKTKMYDCSSNTHLFVYISSCQSMVEVDTCGIHECLSYAIDNPIENVMLKPQTIKFNQDNIRRFFNFMVMIEKINQITEINTFINKYFYVVSYDQNLLTEHKIQQIEKLLLNEISKQNGLESLILTKFGNIRNFVLPLITIFGNYVNKIGLDLMIFSAYSNFISINEFYTFLNLALGELYYNLPLSPNFEKLKNDFNNLLIKST